MSRRIPSVVTAQLPGKLSQREDAALLCADGVQIQRVVRLMPVQEDRDRRDGHMGQTQDRQPVPPPGKIDDNPEIFMIIKTNTCDENLIKYPP